MRIGTVFLILAVMLLLPLGQVRSEAGNVVEKMDSAQLDRLMSDTDSRSLIVAMAAWCTPCRKELPALNNLYRKYKNQGLKIVGISLDLEGPRAMQPIIDKMKVEFPVYWVGEDAIRDYQIDAIPLLFVIKEGKVIEKIFGKRSEKFLDRKIKELLTSPQ
jgi:thiol-disulfide isomerase/thioredoxin